MALSKTIVLENGVTVSYFKILTCFYNAVGSTNEISIGAYLNEAKRIEGVQNTIFVQRILIGQAPSVLDPQLEYAYEQLKLDPYFDGAVDI